LAGDPSGVEPRIIDEAVDEAMDEAVPARSQAEECDKIE
jgi:hypothetical protein